MMVEINEKLVFFFFLFKKSRGGSLGLIGCFMGLGVQGVFSFGIFYFKGMVYSGFYVLDKRLEGKDIKKG